MTNEKKRYSIRFVIGDQEPTSCVVLWEGDAKDANAAEQRAARDIRKRLTEQVLKAQTTMRMR